MSTISLVGSTYEQIRENLSMLLKSNVGYGSISIKMLHLIKYKPGGCKQMFLCSASNTQRR